MAFDQTQKILSDLIKSTHRKLREEAKLLGTEKAWSNHCCNEEDLKNYALAMRDLAVNHWDQNSLKDEKAASRITWVYQAIENYLEQIEKYRDKEMKIVKTLGLPVIELENFKKIMTSKLKVLDVGSCYNPFNKFDIFEVLALDIAPANTDVLKCDFLNVEVTDELLIEQNMVLELKRESFHVIVFSLLLEYLPCPDLRLKCCIKAYNLLEFEGILIIVTPDSNHIGSNAKLIKSWRYNLSMIGFNRICYDKLPHIHCMVFRKTICKEVAERWAKLNGNRGLYHKMYIPQDYNKTAVANVQNYHENVCEWSENTFLADFLLDDCDI